VQTITIHCKQFLGRLRLNFDKLVTPEQELWNLFKKSEVYEFLYGEKGTVPEFCHNFLTFSAKPQVNIAISKIADKLMSIPPHHTPQAIQRSLSMPVTHNLWQRKDKIDYRALHLVHEVNKSLQQAAQEVKQKCKAVRKSVRKSAKAAVTKLTPGAFSPKPQLPASSPSSPPPSSSPSWNLWSSK